MESIWLRRNISIPTWLTADVIAGLTVWGLVVPESMPYSGVADPPPQNCSKESGRSAEWPNFQKRLRSNKS